MSHLEDGVCGELEEQSTERSLTGTELYRAFGLEELGEQQVNKSILLMTV